VFELAVARTGLRDAEAATAGFDPLTVGSVQFDHKAYYPGAHQLHLRITGDRTSGQLLGAQLVGNHRVEVVPLAKCPCSLLPRGLRAYSNASVRSSSAWSPSNSPGTRRR
jgi:pyruvate/2-oxoglutarate dehydrogenase complex dihydrolipoamide dehydrogenase (E3) component